MKVGIDAVGMNGMAAPAVSAMTPVAPDISRPVQAETGAAEESNPQVEEMIEQIQSHIKLMNVSLEFSSYGERGEKIAVVVADKETGEVIREIPTKELQNLYAKMSEVAGLIFNRQI